MQFCKHKIAALSKKPSQIQKQQPFFDKLYTEKMQKTATIQTIFFK